jgi:hypothetical protein
LKPHKTIRSLHDPEISNTRFDNNSSTFTERIIEHSYENFD